MLRKARRCRRCRWRKRGGLPPWTSGRRAQPSLSPASARLSRMSRQPRQKLHASELGLGARVPACGGRLRRLGTLVCGARHCARRDGPSVAVCAFLVLCGAGRGRNPACRHGSPKAAVAAGLGIRQTPRCAGGYAANGPRDAGSIGLLAHRNGAGYRLQGIDPTRKLARLTFRKGGTRA